ncbi:MAG TPA: PAS domain S-box protein [Rhodopila sp.]|nr:PAS domain S-box protein [Rhodopila sp.]
MNEDALRDRLGNALLDTVSDAIIYADAAGSIRFWNKGAENLLGHLAAEVIGQSLDVIIPQPQRARHWEGFQRVMETGVSRYGAGDVMAVPALRKDGSRISVEFTIVPLRDASGRMEGMLSIMRDVTKRFEETRALRREIASLRQPPG